MINVAGLKRAVHLFLALFFLFAGVAHFRHDTIFAQIVPPFLPFPVAIVWVTGMMELAFAAALLTRFRLPLTGVLLSAYLLAVLPANIYMAWANIPFGEGLGGPLILWGRVALQFPLIALVIWATRDGGE